jgi:DNA polymerase
MRGSDKATVFDFLQKAWYTTTGYPPGDYFDALAWSDEAGLNSHAPALSLQDIASKIAACALCPLAATRTHTVPGVGVPEPLVLVIGEGPGAEEDARGEPFVGPAGQLLDKMLAGIHLSRATNCYIANIVKCRPPGNRDPALEEAATCMPYLRQQIAALQPRLILAVGRIAAQYLLNTGEGIGRLRGRFFDFAPGDPVASPEIATIPLMPTYHPSALLRNADLKAPAWEDLKTFGRRLLELAPEYTKC